MNFKYRSIVVLAILTLTFPYKALTQEENKVTYPKVGDTIQDHTFTDLYNYPNSTLKLSELRGKWVILDFWARTCGACIRNFPKMSALSERFKDKVQVIMAGSYHSGPWGIRNNEYQKTKELLEYQKELHNLTFTVALDDFKEKYDLGSVPLILVIDPQGIIVAKTVSVNEQQISNLITDKRVYFSRAFSKHEEIAYDDNLPFLTIGSYSNGGIDTSFIFRSLLSPYDYNVPKLFGNLMYDMANSNKALKTGRFEVSKLSLKQLLRLAFFGSAELDIYNPYREIVSPEIVLETKDTSIFIVDEATLQGLYSYSLSMPKERVSLDYLKYFMQQDLCRYFGINASIEKRIMPVFELRIIDHDKAALLKTKGKEPTHYYEQEEPGRLRFDNYDISQLLYGLVKSINGQQAPLINATDIDYKVDIDMRVDIYSIESINKGLEQYGLMLVAAEKLLSTIVVRDLNI